MAGTLVEQPVDPSAFAGNGFVLGNHALRVAYANSFYIPNTAQAATGYLENFIGVPDPPFFGYGAVQINSVFTDQIGVASISGLSSGLVMVYVNPLTAGAANILGAAASSPPSFPAGTLALAVLTVDAVGRIFTVTDSRPSGLSSAPNLGSGMTESVSDATKRINFVNNYAVPRTYSLSPTVPQQISLPAPGFLLGAGSVVLSSQVITSPAKFYSCATNSAGDGWGLMTVNAINQFYVSPSTGLVGIQIPAVSGTFPANSLAICEVTTDATGQIRNIVDFRPSYI